MAAEMEDVSIRLDNLKGAISGCSHLLAVHGFKYKPADLSSTEEILICDNQQPTLSGNNKM